MRLTQTTELAIIAALIGYIALTPGIPVVRDFLNTAVGKALALGLAIYVWKFVSQPISLLLVVAVLSCMRSREGMTDTQAHCPMGFTLGENNTCKDSKGMPGPPPTVCLPGQKWDAAAGKCEGPAPGGAPMGAGMPSSTAPSTAPSMPASAAMPPTGMPPGMTPPPGMTMPVTPPISEGFVPNDGKGGKIYAPA